MYRLTFGAEAFGQKRGVLVCVVIQAMPYGRLAGHMEREVEVKNEIHQYATLSNL